MTKYKTGITFGAFDPFHYGHIKLFEHAKEQCENLIVCVSTRAYIKKHKNRDERVLFKDRMEIIANGIKFVNTVTWQDSKFGKKEAVERFNPDVIFVGDDWNRKTFKGEGLGVPVIYLPRTKGISSTKLKTKEVKSHLFIRIPRTGSTSICQALYGRNVEHMTAERWKKLIKGEWKDRFVFTIVRNPYDRFVSAYYYFKEMRELGLKSVNEFLKKTDLKEFAGLSPRNEFIVRPQVDFIYSKIGYYGDEKLLVDYIGRYEQLKTAWGTICDTLNIPYKELTCERASYSGGVELNEKSREKIRRFYKRDFELLKYNQ